MADPRERRAGWLLAALAATACLALGTCGAWSLMSRPHDHWDEVERAREYLERGYPDLAFQAVAKIRDEAPGAAEGLTLAGKVLLMRGNVSPARQVLERSLKMQSKQAEAAKILAAIYLALGDGSRGLELLKQATELDPLDFRPWFAMGKVHHDLGDLSAGAEAYREAIARNPPAAELKESRIGRVRTLLDAARHDEAAVELENLRSLARDEPVVLGLGARLARDLNQEDEALQLSDKALEFDPNNFDARLVRAQVWNLRGQPEIALADLERAVEINPNHLGALQLLLQTRTKTGPPEVAAAIREQLQQARDRTALMDRLTKEINQRPNDPEPRYRMGQAALEGKMETLAYQCFQAALDVDPNHRPSRQALSAMTPPPGVLSSGARPMPGPRAQH